MVVGCCLYFDFFLSYLKTSFHILYNAERDGNVDVKMNVYSALHEETEENTINVSIAQPILDQGNPDLGM